MTLIVGEITGAVLEAELSQGRVPRRRCGGRMLLLWFTVCRILGSSEHSSEKGLHRRSYLGWGRVQVDTQGSGARVVQARGLVSLVS